MFTSRLVTTAYDALFGWMGFFLLYNEHNDIVKMLSSKLKLIMKLKQAKALNFFITGTRTYDRAIHYTSLALHEKYLNVCERILGILSFGLSATAAKKYPRAETHWPRGNLLSQNNPLSK